MSKFDSPAGRAVALRYEGGDGAPVVVASGMGYLAEKIVEVAANSGVPIYEDNSLAIVEISVYFLNFDPTDPDNARRQREDGSQGGTR